MRLTRKHDGAANAGIWTNLSRDLNKDGYAAIEGTASDWKSPDEGASTIIVAAFDSALNGECPRPGCHGDGGGGWANGLAEPAGSFLSDCQYYDAPAYATDPEIAERLWNLSEELVKENFEYSAKL